MRNLQSWYHAALGGVTFRLRDPVVEVLQSSYDSVWFQGDGEFASLFYRAADETWSLAGEGGYDDPLYRWVIYVDASPAAGQCGGCGTSGVAVLARGDLQGLAGEPRIEAEFTEYSSVCRYVGGLGHELGHAFGLPHPAVCDQGLPACYEGDLSPADSLLWTGYTIYPDSYFLPEQADALSASPFLASGLTVASLTDCKLITACGAGAASCNGVCSPPSDGLLPSAPLYNGSFEDCLYSPQGKPQAWDRQADDPRAAALTWDSTDVRDGAHSVRIQHATPNDSRWVQAIPIEPQRAYRFCGWIKTQNVVSTQGNAGANLSILGTSAYAGISGTDDWSEVCVPFHSGSNSTVTVAARLGMSFGLATGTAWFDSLRLEEVIPSVTPTHTFTPTNTAGATMTPTETRTATATMIFTDTPAPTPTREASDTPTSTRTPTLTPTVTPSPSRTPSRTPSGAPPLRCGGDCDRDGAVKVNELIIGVRIALLKETIGKCQAADSNGDGKVVVNELVRAVKIALRGC